MSKLRTAAQQALEALENPWAVGPEGVANAITTLRAALAEPDVPETNFGNMVPAGWFEGPFGEFRANQLFKHSWPAQTVAWSIPLYLAPPQRKPLTEEALSKIIDAEIGFNSCVGWEEDFARAIERAHGIT